MDVCIGFLMGIGFSCIVLYIYLRRLMFGGDIFVDRTYDRPEIYLQLDRRYRDACEVAKQRYLLLRVKVVHNRDRR